MSHTSMLTFREASLRLPYSEPSLRARVQKGELSQTRIGGRLYLSEGELREKFGPLFRETTAR